MNKASEEGEVGIVACGWTLGITARVWDIQLCLVCVWQPGPSRSLVFSPRGGFGQVASCTESDRWEP